MVAQEMGAGQGAAPRRRCGGAQVQSALLRAQAQRQVRQQALLEALQRHPRPRRPLLVAVLQRPRCTPAIEGLHQVIS